ncbi:DNA cytosine methyltransferase [Desulfuromonas sp. KJ2020]|uniref:DNA cytosine methyltransferase n=1 Tax=Desulfuromonas sp. KJ2020 TaxID=2919173 RepID=UPI0020A79B47|nr:DNA cytosine methyltransferase [Desulfuromonas sp. KJ2020]MCP3177283.1 DNA cytosine methyltransferase [Desulfuromonas sp. KJ2020]
MATSFNPGQPKIYRCMHLFAGIGGGSLGFKWARFNWRGIPGRFENILAIDSDPGACESYLNITRSRSECWDLFSRDQYTRFHGREPQEGWAEVTAADINEACGGIAPDVVFTSPPCKGLSGLLPQASAKLDRYQALNELTLRGIRLTIDAFPDSPPRVLLLENVPRIKSRGKHLLKEIVRLLQSRGYAVDLSDHDCGELGGLGQRRKRFLLIARHKESLQPFIYQPPKRALKTIGDIIGPLPLPDTEDMGPMHRLPRLKWLTWLRLALIPAGGDWRDLQKIEPEDFRIKHYPRPGVYGVMAMSETCGAVTGGSGIGSSNGPQAIADPRVPLKSNRHHAHFSVGKYDETGGTVTGATHAANGAACIADPRLHKNLQDYSGSPGLYGVNGWAGQMPAVTGMAKVSSSNTPAAIADPRLPGSKGTYPNRFKIIKWDKHVPVVTGDTDVQCGAPSIEDPRLGCAPRGNTKGPFGVQPWSETASTVFGSLDLHAGAAAVNDPRIPGPNERLDPPPVIISLDGTWHRPLTTLELAALQSFPVRLEDGSPFVLAGNNDGKWREWIGNAVPPLAAKAIGEAIGESLLQADLGETFVLGMTPVWVSPEKIRPSRIYGIQ